jgi:hypothetical protein
MAIRVIGIVAVVLLLAMVLALAPPLLRQAESTTHAPTSATLPASNPASGPATDATRPAIDPNTQLLINLLRSEEYRERERAADELRKIGPSLLPILRQLEQEDDDPEVRRWASVLIDELAQVRRAETDANHTAPPMAARIQMLDRQRVELESRLNDPRLTDDQRAVIRRSIELIRRQRALLGAVD